MFRVAKPKSNKRQKLSNGNETYLWHLRLGHISLDRISRLTKDGPLKDLSVGSLPVCESCLESKMTKRPFTTNGLRTEEPLELIHSNVCGPFAMQAVTTREQSPPNHNQGINHNNLSRLKFRQFFF